MAWIQFSRVEMSWYQSNQISWIQSPSPLEAASFDRLMPHKALASLISLKAICIPTKRNPEEVGTTALHSTPFTDFSSHNGYLILPFRALSVSEDTI